MEKLSLIVQLSANDATVREDLRWGELCQILVPRLRVDDGVEIPAVSDVDLQGAKMRLGRFAPRPVRAGEAISFAVRADGEQVSRFPVREAARAMRATEEPTAVKTLLRF